MKIEKTLKFREEMNIGHDVNIFFDIYHNHEYYEFFYVVRGKALNIMDDGVQVLEKANIIAIRPEDKHFIQSVAVAKNGKTDNFEFFNIPVPIDFMEKQFLECEELKQNIINGTAPACVKISTTELALISTLALEIKEMLPSKKRNYKYFTLVRHLCAMFLKSKDEKMENIPKWFVDLYVNAERTSAAELNYNLLLKSSDVSNKTLLKNFKKFLNITPSAYINMRKMKEAYALVIAGEMNFTEIAMHLGYSDYSHFYRDFTDYYKASPRDFAKKSK